MSHEILTSVDTITIASLMRAMQVLLDAYQAGNPDPEALDALQAKALHEIKALDTGAFAYEEQAEGLAEGLLLTQAVFRWARLGRGGLSAPSSVEGQGIRPATDPAFQAHRG